MKLNDYELIALSHEGNEDATRIIYEKYKPLIIKKSKKAFNYASHHGIDINDIIQESYIALDEAIKNFNQEDTASFYTFAMLCVERRITNYIKKTTNKRSMVLNDAVTLDDVFGNMIGDNINIENSIVTKDDDISKIKTLRNGLTPLEKNVFDLKAKGFTFEEIAKSLNKDLKSVYNTFNRIKIKYKNINEIDN